MRHQLTRGPLTSQVPFIKATLMEIKTMEPVYPKRLSQQGQDLCQFQACRAELEVS